MNRIFQYYRPTLGHSWLIVALTLAGGLAFGVFFQKVPQSVSYAVMMLIPIAFCWLMGSKASALPEARAVPINRPNFGKLGGVAFFLLAAVAMLLLSVVVEPTTSLIPMPDMIRQVFEDAFINSKLWDMIVSTCILAPLCEEFLCRGMMLRGMLGQMRPGRAIFWSALIFAVMHMNPWQSIPAFIIGLFFGWVYWKTHSLWVTIFMHCVNNSLATVTSRLLPDMPVDAGLKDLLPSGTYWAVYAACAVALVLILYLLHEKTVPPEIPSRVEA